MLERRIQETRHFDIEKKITRPLEKEIKTITGIDKLTSTSVQGYSTISVEFDFSVTTGRGFEKSEG